MLVSTVLTVLTVLSACCADLCVDSGKCTHYMKHIAMKPPRLHCAHCDQTYSLPANGHIKLFKELTCPLDGFELLLFTQVLAQTSTQSQTQTQTWLQTQTQKQT